MYEVKKSSIALSILAVFLVSLPVSVMMLFIMVSDGLIRFVFRLFLLYINNQIYILYYHVINPDQAKLCWSFNFIWFWMCKKHYVWLQLGRKVMDGKSCTEARSRNTCEHSMQPWHYHIKLVLWYVGNVGDVVSKLEFAFPNWER